MSDELNGTEATNSDESQLDTLRESIDDPVVLKAQLAKEAEARRQLTARARDAETKLKTEREARIKLEEGQTQTITNPPTPTEDERLELRLNGYSKEEVNYIMANGGSKVLEDKNSYTAIAINTRREQLKAEQAANQTGSQGGEDSFREVNFNIPRNPTRQDLKTSIEAMEKVLPHAD